MREIELVPLSPERFKRELDAHRYATFREATSSTAELLQGRTVWNLSSASAGGGVAEMLQSLLGYAVGAGVDTRWLVIDGSEDFFRLTKRIHNRLHGNVGDGGELGSAERASYEQALAGELEHLDALVHGTDLVVVHDPQPAGLIPSLKRRTAALVWRCHVGVDDPNDITRSAWDFLRRYVADADALIFSRRQYAWDRLDADKVRVIHPSIDAFSPKNQAMAPEAIGAVLKAAGLIDGDSSPAPAFARNDGAPALVTTSARMIEDARVPPEGRVVVQVSRWDRLKDPEGVLTGFASHVAGRAEAHLILAGPDPNAITDDPEQAAIFGQCVRAWSDCDAAVKRRIHLACLPMQDSEENGAIVNALQRRADVIVQKSLAEGFGLTVAEAMWKARPTVASRVGGIQDQIEDGRSGLLVDPADPAEFAEAVLGLLGDGDRARIMGERAQRRIRDEFLAPRDLTEFGKIFREVVG